MSSSGIVAGASAEAGLHNLLSLISDPDAYKARLKELQDTTRAADEAVARVGKASEIEAIRKQLDKDRAEQDRINSQTEARIAARLEAARRQAEDIVAKAKEQSLKAGNDAKATTDRANSVHSEAQRIHSEAEERHKKLSDREQTVIDRTKKLDVREAELTAREDEVKQEKARLAKIAKQLQPDLG